MNKDHLEQQTLKWLTDVGYTHVFGPDLATDNAHTGSHRNQVVLIEHLREAIARLNPAVPQAAQADALRQILNLATPVTLMANQRFHRLLTGGVPVAYQKDGETRGDFVRLMDWVDPAANAWLAVNRFEIEGPHHTRRPDVILFVNGLPLVLMELNDPADDRIDIWHAYAQIQTYKEQIPEVFRYNEILVIADGKQARMGSLSAKTERYMQWRTIDGVTLDPLGPLNELETLVRGMLAPTYLLDYLRFFVLFEDDGVLVKKIAGYHQFHAVRAALQQVLLASRPGGRSKGGVVWHTQGSGKSITMTCFAARAIQETALENPTIVVITDRNDLDGQLFGVFSLAQDLLHEQPVQAETRQDLYAKLANRPSGGIVFTTIQKFMPGDDETRFPMLSNRRNIVVIADEAHRTQYGFGAKLKTLKTPRPTAENTGTPGLSAASSRLAYRVGYAHHLRDALPNATFIAFTGTPVSSEDRDTRAVFGDYIHVYDIQQAKEDGATVAIYFESRLAKLSLKTEELPHLDEEDADELSEDEEENQLAQLKRPWVVLEEKVGMASRVAVVAADIMAHFEERNKAQNGKAMVVAMSRKICVRLYDKIVALRPDWHDPDPARGAIKIVMTGSASDAALLRPHIHSSHVKKRLEKRFKDPADPLRIVIVRDMWLTGFDVPCAHTLYVDKPMRGHNLMQAIARVNRVFQDKQGGLVVDYIGIANELKKALREYSASMGRGRPVIDAAEAYGVLEEKLDILRSMLHGYDYSDFPSGCQKRLAGAANHVLGLYNGMQRFADAALAMSHAFTLCCTLDEARAMREEVAFMQAVKLLLTKREFGESKRIDEELAIRQIIGSAVVSEHVVDIFEAVGLDKPNINIFDDAFLAEVRDLPQRNLAIELLERLLEGEIKSRFAGNIAQEKRFYEILASLMTRHHERTIATDEVIEELIEMAKKFRAATERSNALGLSEDEIRFYDALADNESAARALSDETFKKIAHELTETLRKNLSVDWATRDSVRAQLRLMVKRILRKYKYPPDHQEGAIELVLRQAEALGESWADRYRT